jgi:transcription elongation factor GreA
MDNNKQMLFTEEGYNSLVNELETLKTTKLQEVKTNLAEARAFGDLSENSEYDEAKNEQAKVVTRIAELEQIILTAKIIDESEIEADLINVGSYIKLHDYYSDKDDEFHIVGSNEADPLKNKISDQSPIGSALIGLKVGAETSVHTPIGERKFKILEVHRSKNVKE